MMGSGDPVIKLMVIGKVNEKLKNMISKPTLTEIDLKLLKGIYIKNQFKKNIKKGLFDTFYPNEIHSKKSKVFRKFNSVIIEDTIEDDKIKDFNSKVARGSEFMENLKMKEIRSIKQNPNSITRSIS